MLDHPMPSLAAIRAFEAAARLGSFTKAGRELGTSSASVSYHVRQLEAQIGVSLFHRHPHRVALTEAGEAIAREATNAFTALRASFARAVERDQGKLSVTTLPTFATSWLAPKLGLFRERHPDISIELATSEAAEDLAGGRFDVAIRNGDGRWPGLRTIELFPSLFMPLCVPALKDQARSIGERDGPSRLPLLGRPDWWEIWYRALGFDHGPPASRFGTSLATEHLDVAAALSGHGVVIASPILFADEIRSGRLVPAHDLVAPAGRSFWLTYPVARQHSGKIVRFRDWLCAEAAAARDSAALLIGNDRLL